MNITGELNLKLKDKLIIKAKKLKAELTAIYYAYQDPNIKIISKIIIAMTVAYALSPIDLIPDFIPIIGYLDDLIILPALITLAIKTIPEEIMEKARERAKTEPIKLKKNWIFGILFIIFWVIIISLIIKRIL